MSDIPKLSDNARHVLSQLVGYSNASDNYDHICSLFVGFSSLSDNAAVPADNKVPRMKLAQKKELEQKPQPYPLSIPL